MVKKFILSVLCVPLICMLFALAAFSAELAPYSDYRTEYDGFISGIPEDVREELPSEIFSGDVDEISKATVELTSPKSFFRILLDTLGFRMKDALKMAAAVTALLLLSVPLRSMFVGSDEVNKVFSLCMNAVITLILAGSQISLFMSADAFLKRLLTLVDSMLPLMGVLYAAGGNVGTASAEVSSLGFFIGICENILVITLMPSVGICLAFAVAGAFGADSRIGEISGAFKKLYTYGLGLFSALMALVMGVQTTLTARADSIGARAAKYALGSFIPVLGGTVGDNLRTAAASIEYLRSGSGALGITVILLMLLPALLSLALGKISVDLTSSLARLLGCSTESKILADISNIYGYVLAVCVICSILFIYALTIFMRCSAAIGG